MTVWTGTEEKGVEPLDLQAELAGLITAHDRAWDAMTDLGIHQRARKDPEAQYHWGAAEACEAVLDDLRSPVYAELCPTKCGCRGNGHR